MSFVIYDLTFMALFILGLILFLYKRRKNLKRQGLLYLYPTRVGIQFIDKFSARFEKILRPLQYAVIGCGYILMVIGVWMIGRLAWVYISSPTIARDLKVPVLMPLVPYLPSLFKINYLPQFPFIDWILVIAIIAIPHEFAHGIFARLNNIKIHSTGFGFLGPFLAAFVEPDEEKMNKSSKKAQLSVLSAGTFANIITSIAFVIVMWIFFAAAFHPAGVQFDSYSMTMINVSDITGIDGYTNISSMENISLIIQTNDSLIPVFAKNKTFFIPPETLQASLALNNPTLIVYDDTAAARARLSGTLVKIGGEAVTNKESVKTLLLTHRPNETVEIVTQQTNGTYETYQIPLGEQNGSAYLGIQIYAVNTLGIYEKARITFLALTSPLLYEKYVNNMSYDSYLGDFGLFVYYLLWWIVLISFSVALMNMIPLGIFDGGRFFLITIWGITGSKRVGEWAYKASTYILLALVAAMMVKWIFVIW